ncbi:MAG: cell wall hydrolase [Erysipelotrichales bacterium]|nr:cell wall hydrolase [Erysipelotrichales bacterium]
MSKNEVLTKRIEELRDEKNRLQEKIFLKKSSVVDTYSNVDIPFFANDNNLELFNELKNKLDQIHDFDSEINLLNKKFDLYINELELEKRTILNDLKIIENKSGKKRLQKRTYKEFRKGLQIPAKEYALYNSLLNELKAIDAILRNVKHIKREQFKINWSYVKTLSLEDKYRYFNNLGIILLCEDLVNPRIVNIGGEYKVSRNRIDLFKKCHFASLKYGKLKNSNKVRISNFITSIKERIDSINPNFKKNFATASLLFTMTLGFAFCNKDNDSTDITDNNIFDCDLLVNTFDNASETIDNLKFSRLFSKTTKNTEVVEREEDDMFSMEPISVVVVDDNQTSQLMSYEETLEEQEETDVLTFSASEIKNIVFYDDMLCNIDLDVKELNEGNNEIVSDYHLTYNNTTYYVSEKEFYYLLYVAQHECNGTYEDALTVISIILNRCEDYRFELNSPLEVIKVEGQFEVWDEVQAENFANNPNKEINPNVYNALVDALYNGIRNNDYVEFKASNSSDYTKKGEKKYQFVENGNKVHNLARTLDRADEEQEEVKKLILESYDF